MSATEQDAGRLEVDRVLLELLQDAPEGDAPTELETELLRFAAASSVAVLDVDGMQRSAERALELGAGPDQLHELAVLVSGLGTHTLFEATRVIDRLAPTPAPDEDRRALRQRYIGDDAYWDGLEREVPGFLDALLRRSPEAYAAFFEYCAVPWRTRAVRAHLKELASIAVDATPAHTYLPGLRLHVANARSLGVGRTAILAAVAIGGAAGAAGTAS